MELLTVTVHHGYKQASYTAWKFLILKKFNVLTDKCTVSKVVSFNKKNKYYVSYRFNTKAFFKDFREIFYMQKNKDKKKKDTRF
jgi:hypothetical protein